MELKDFTEENKKFWENYTNRTDNGDVVVLVNDNSFIMNILGYTSAVLNKAKGYRPVWLDDERKYEDFCKSYVPSAALINYPKLLFKAVAFVIAVIKFIKILFTGDILSTEYDGIRYGDSVYDVYLTRNQAATIKKPDFKLLNLIRKYIYRHEQIKRIFKEFDVKAVLVIQKEGLNSAILTRLAHKYGKSIFTGALQEIRPEDNYHTYLNQPQKFDIEKILTLDENLFKKLFEDSYYENTKGNSTTCLAFSEDKKTFTDKNKFCEAYGLDKNKKNIFIMMHAFNDYPHSAFNGMLFKDYGDWFIKTLEYAKTDKSVNWIFKTHPYMKFYPLKDFAVEDFFKNVSENIILLSEKDNLNAKCIKDTADAIITCVGSAGFELPAVGGIPSVIAGDNHYRQIDFAIAPDTREEYFKVLSNLKNVQKLSREKQKLAQALYIYIYNISAVKIAAYPVTSYSEIQSGEENFFDRIIAWNTKKKAEIFSQTEDIIRIIRGENYRKLQRDIFNPDNESGICAKI